MATDNNYTPVADGLHDCKIVFAKRIETAYKHDIKAHVVFDLKLVATDTDTESPAAYKATFPILLVPGFEWGFFDEEKKANVWRKATAADTKAVIEYAQKCFPAWKDYCDALPDGSDEAAFAWFTNQELCGGVTVRAKLTRGAPYTGSDGLEHENLNARIYAPFESKPIIAEGESRQIANALKAAGVKLFGKPKAASAPKAAPLPPTPPKAKAKTVDQARDEAFAKYQEFFASDTTGAGFYPKCAEILKRDMNTWESWTVADWDAITKDMTDIPF